MSEATGTDPTTTPDAPGQLVGLIVITVFAFLAAAVLLVVSLFGLGWWSNFALTVSVVAARVSTSDGRSLRRARRRPHAYKAQKTIRDLQRHGLGHPLALVLEHQGIVAPAVIQHRDLVDDGPSVVPHVDGATVE